LLAIGQQLCARDDSGQANVMGFNTNAIKESQVAYYKCANLPSAAR